MKRYYSILLSILTATSLSLAADITPQQATDAASRFLNSQEASALRSARQTRVASGKLTLAPVPTKAYYAINQGEHDGFVIVAGDDQATTILGYAEAGHFCYDSLPDNLRWWLGQYQEEIEQMQAQTTGESSIRKMPAAATDDSTKYTEGDYLVKSLWSQGSPYNLKTPVQSGGHCATGCVATCWSQILFYYKYPAQGVGQHSYLWGNQWLSTDFRNPYDWDNILPQYSANATDSQKIAVAQLLSDVGIASELYYGASSTSGHEYNSLWAMVHHFQYDPSADLRYRNYYDDADWDDMLRENLDQGWPLYYGGYNTDGGHAFVCDGYKGDMFHFNWGWGGSYNGFFVSSALHSNYNKNQCAVFCFRPDEGGIYRPKLMLDGNPTTSNGNQVFRFGTIRAGLYDSIHFETVLTMKHLEKDTTRVFPIVEYSSTDWGDNSWGITPLRFTDSLAAGTYRLSMRYRYAGDTIWQDFRYRRGKAHYITIQVDSVGKRTLLTYDGDDDSIEFTQDGILYRIKSETEKQLEVLRNNFADTICTIPGSLLRNGETYQVVEIADSAFMGCARMRHLILGKGIKTLGKNAFSSCQRLEDIELPASLQTIGNSAFDGYTRLATIHALAATPPNLEGSTVFPRKQLAQTILWIPCGYGEAYRGVNIWNKMEMLESDFALHLQTSGEGTIRLTSFGCDSVMLTAEASTGYTFSRWSNGAETDTITLILEEDTEITAIFEAEQVDLEETVNYSIQRNGRMIHVSAEGATICLYSLDGRLIKKACSELQYSMDRGMYILSVNGHTSKLIYQ